MSQESEEPSTQPLGDDEAMTTQSQEAMETEEDPNVYGEYKNKAPIWMHIQTFAFRQAFSFPWLLRAE